MGLQGIVLSQMVMLFRVFFFPSNENDILKQTRAYNTSRSKQIERENGAHIYIGIHGLLICLFGWNKSWGWYCCGLNRLLVLCRYFGDWLKFLLVCLFSRRKCQIRGVFLLFKFSFCWCFHKLGWGVFLVLVPISCLALRLFCFIPSLQ